MQLLLMRHGIAESLEESTDYNDAGRRLTDKGQSRVEDVARLLAAMDLVPSVYLTSPRLRALETAEIVAKVMRWPHPPQVTETLNFFGSLGEFLGLLRGFPKSSIVLATGHEPVLSEWLAELIPGEATPHSFKKAAVAVLEFSGDPKAVKPTYKTYLTAKMARSISPRMD